MESGTPGLKSTRDGWLNRYLHAKEHRERQPVPRRGARAEPAAHAPGHGAGARHRPAQPVRRPRRHGDRHDVDVFEAQYAQAADSLLRADRHGSLRCRQDAEGRESRRLHAANGARVPAHPASATRCGRSRRSSRPTSASKSRSPRLGNWDHHANEGSARRARSPTVSTISRAGIAAFAQDLGDRMADVVVVTMSEFGRTVKENGNRGTDHGHGNAMLDPRRQRQGRQGLRQVAGPRARAALAGPRPGDHHRLPRRLRRMRHEPPGRQGHLEDFPGTHVLAEARTHSDLTAGASSRSEPAGRSG